MSAALARAGVGEKLISPDNEDDDDDETSISGGDRLPAPNGTVKILAIVSGAHLSCGAENRCSKANQNRGLPELPGTMNYCAITTAGWL